MQKCKTINQSLSATAAENPDKVAIISFLEDTPRRITFKEFEIAVNAIASWLIRKQVAAGDRILLAMPNCPQWALTYFAIVGAGAIAVPVSNQSTAAEFASIISDCSPKAAFISSDVFSKLGSFKDKIVIAVADVADGLANLDGIISSQIKAELPQVTKEMPASLVYTSGTTGTPKGVVLTHENFCSNVGDIAKLEVVKSGDSVLSLLPLSHTYAFTSSLLAPVFLGGTIVYSRSMKGADVAYAVRQGGVTVLPAVPQFMAMISDKALEKYRKSPKPLRPIILLVTRTAMRKKFGNQLRLFVCGGAKLDTAIVADIGLLGYKVVEGYGLTETSPILTLNTQTLRKRGSVGKPLDSVELRIDKPDKDGIGEVLARGPNIMQGYYKQPELTGQVIKDGWFHTGDLGHIDPDGYLFLTARAKDVIVLASGKNVYPEDVENEYLKSKYFREICVLEGQGGRGLFAVIVPKTEAIDPANAASMHDFIQWELENLSASLPAHWHINRFVITFDPLPRTRLGKLRRFEIREKYISQGGSDRNKREYSDEDIELLSQDAAQKIIEYLCAESRKDVHLDDNLELDLGFDSLARIEAADKLESMLDIKIPDESLAAAMTVRDIVKISVKLQNQRGETKELQAQSFSWQAYLQQEPPEDIRKKIRIEPAFSDKLVTYCVIPLLKIVYKIFWPISIKGIENIPSGACILCPNHSSFLDGPAMVAALPPAMKLKTFFIGLAAYFEHPLVSWAIVAGKLIALDPSAQLANALLASAWVLRNNSKMCIFPQGQRSIDGSVNRFKKGVAILAKELQVPLVPVYIKGSYQAWPRHKKWPRSGRIEVRFGHPIDVDELSKQGSGDYVQMAELLRQKVIELGKG